MSIVDPILVICDPSQKVAAKSLARRIGTVGFKVYTVEEFIDQLSATFLEQIVEFNLPILHSIVVFFTPELLKEELLMKLIRQKADTYPEGTVPKLVPIIIDANTDLPFGIGEMPNFRLEPLLHESPEWKEFVAQFG